MVGVPGRSSACNVCRKRKISCDYRRPECSQCLNSKRNCDYIRARVFIINEEGSHKTIYRKSRIARTDATNQHGRAAPILQPATQASQSSSGQTTLLRQLSLTTLTQQQLVSNAVSTMQKSSSGLEFLTHTWASSLSTFIGTTDSLASSPLACYFAWQSRHSNDPSLRHTGQHFYRQGLIEARKALCNPLTALKDQTLACCLALVAYETLECPDNNLTGYRWHRNGCIRIVQARGADMHRTGLGHELFTETRLHGILQAFEQHTPAYFVTGAWSNVPWSIQPKSAYECLVDIFAMGPAIMFKADCLTATPPDRALPLVQSMWADCFNIDKKLRSFLTKFERSYTGLLYWEEALTSVTEVDDEDNTTSKVEKSEPYSTSAYRFQDSEVARILTLYWGIQSMVWSGLYNLCEAFRQCTGQRPELSSDLDWRIPIRNVCKSVHYCTHSTPAGSGPMRIAATLNIIIDVMRHQTGCEVEREFAAKANQELGQKWLYILRCEPW